MREADYTSVAGLSTPQHTPRPWVAQYSSIDALISAAPDLLAWATRIRAEIEAWPDGFLGIDTTDLAELDAAIAKARGVSP